VCVVFKTHHSGAIMIGFSQKSALSPKTIPFFLLEILDLDRCRQFGNVEAFDECGRCVSEATWSEDPVGTDSSP